MRLDIGVKESSKKKLVRSTWAGHVTCENGHRIKSDLERVREEWENDRLKELETGDRERSKRKERGRKKDKGKRNHDQLTPDNNVRKIITTKCNLTLV